MRYTGDVNDVPDLMKPNFFYDADVREMVLDTAYCIACDLQLVSSEISRFVFTDNRKFVDCTVINIIL